MVDVAPVSSRKIVAEAIGTFALVYIGVLAIHSTGIHTLSSTTTHPIPVADLTTVALAHGLTIACLVSATMMISGGQLNPAVTIGLLAGNKIPLAQALANIGGQLLGGILGGYAAYFSLGSNAGALAAGTPALGAFASGADVTLIQGILIEAILTFLLVFVVFGTGVNPAFGARLGGLAIGLTVTLDIMAGGPLTGAAMNPARWLGSAMPAQSYPDAIVYWVGPIAGAILAGLVWRFVLFEREARPSPE